VRYGALALLLSLLASAIVLGGCGEKQERLEPAQRDFELLLDYFPNADHAPIYAAEANGHFREAGLEAKIRQPPDPAAPIKQVAAGRVDLAISYEPEVLRARDQGLPVVSVGALVRGPLTSIISLPEARIKSPGDLAGKRVGTSGIDYQSAYLRTVLEEAGADPRDAEERNVGFNLTPALLTRKVDAVLGAFWNYEGTELRLKRKDPKIIRIEDAGVPTYDELVLVANERALERDSGRIRAFIKALARGTEDLMRDQGCSRRTASWTRPSSARSWTSRCRGLRRRRAGPTVTRTRASGETSPVGWPRRACSRDRRALRAPSPTSCSPARACSPRTPWRRRGAAPHGLSRP
jgi:putative hydroxymethylpyrimidine transport system substrate-binding protein